MPSETLKGTYVPPVRTPVSPDALRAALAERLGERGINASSHALTTLVAMSAHETGEWVSCWNNNLGNVKSAPDWAGQYTCLTNVYEILKGVKRWFSPRGETIGKNGPLKGPGRGDNSNSAGCAARKGSQLQTDRTSKERRGLAAYRQSHRDVECVRFRADDLDKAKG